MSDRSLVLTSDQPGLPAPPQFKAKSGRTLAVTGKNKRAIDLMVWHGLKRNEAAEQAGLKDHALYVALSKPHVKAYYMQQLDVLRTSERARNFHALTEVRDQTANAMARVNAVKAMEQIEQVSEGTGISARTPGVTIVIAGEQQRVAVLGHQRETDAKPLIDNDTGQSVAPISYRTD